MPNMIAIDGPAASGKSTLAKRLAEDLGYLYFDTGVLYRAVTYLVLMNKVPVEDETAVTRLAEESTIDVSSPSVADGRDYDVWVGEQDITWEIRRPEVEAEVSRVSAYAGVRQALTAQQRRIGQRGRVVMAGRDIGTVVLPEADLKIYLDASVEERARRRYAELQKRGESLSYEGILSAMKARDRIDSSREIAPLKPAEDAIVLNSDGLSIDQVLEKVHQFISNPPE